MAMNKFAFGLLLVVWFMFSCTDRSTGGAWDVDLMEVSADSLDYSLFVDSIRYIPLECTEECMVGAVTDVAFAEDNIFVFDIKQQTVWVFSREGAYESCVSRQGNGPGEYVYISQFEYDKQHGRIAVLASGQGQILYYSPRGEHLGTVNLSVKADDFKLTPQDDIILSCAGRDDASAGIYVTDAAGQNARPLVLRRENHLVYATFPWELCAYDDVVCFMAPNFENGVYHWEGGGLSLAYPFRMLPEPGQDYEETVSLQHFGDFLRTTYLEGEKWILATYWSADPAKDLRVFLYSKAEKRHWVGRDFRNDVDRRGVGIRTAYTDNNTLVTWEENKDPDRNPVVGILQLK